MTERWLFHTHLYLNSVLKKKITTSERSTPHNYILSVPLLLNSDRKNLINNDRILNKMCMFSEISTMCIFLDQTLYFFSATYTTTPNTNVSYGQQHF